MKALIFGKFLPFHNGHKAMIDYALNKYNHVTVVIFSKGGEQWSGELRTNWILETYINNSNVRVIHCPVNYCDPYNDSSWEVWANTLKVIGTDVTHLITSEIYGYITANLCSWQHDMFDENRTTIPISGTAIRTNQIENWRYLPNSTRKSLVRKIALVGAESTGKSTLAERLANRYYTNWVPEFGREYYNWKDISQATPTDFEVIVNEQKRMEDRLAITSNGLLFCDTEILVTRAWSNYLLGFEPNFIKNKIGNYDLYSVTNPNTKWIQDGTRLCNQKDRQTMTSFILEKLSKASANYICLPLELEAAFKTICQLVTTNSYN